MSLLNEILIHNETFVTDKQYEPFITTKFPDKRL
ncbi:MAG: carbonic anhydrase, partial [Planococcaceae bacterium]|nr:carbonic anhydrase [Planococcaceae bacterium]